MGVPGYSSSKPPLTKIVESADITKHTVMHAHTCFITEKLHTKIINHGCLICTSQMYNTQYILTIIQIDTYTCCYRLFRLIHTHAARD
jgi:hypothetical protein